MNPPRAPFRACCVALGVAVLTLPAACGQSAPPPPTTQSVDAAVQSQLRSDVRTLAVAVAAHQLDRADAALAALDADTAAAHAAGTLDDGRLRRIRAAAAAVADDLAGLSTPPPRTITVRSVPSVTQRHAATITVRAGRTVTVVTTAPPPSHGPEGGDGDSGDNGHHGGGSGGSGGGGGGQGKANQGNGRGHGQ